jgi:hypothetical protein
MGGGTTLVGANRKSAKVVGCDINPIAHWIVRESLKEIDLARLDAYFEQLAQSAGERVGALRGDLRGVEADRARRLAVLYGVFHLSPHQPARGGRF